jgi:hypothetical protein
MMMKMLEAAGIPVVTDKLRVPDQNNPNGYYELERVKQLKDGDVGWLKEAKGCGQDHLGLDHPPARRLFL